MNINKSLNRTCLNRIIHDSLFTNGIHLTLTTFSTSLFGFLFWMVATRYYTSEEVGLASAIVSSMSFLAILSLLGFNITLIRFLPGSNNRKEMINSCLTLSIVAALFVSLIFILGLNIYSSKLLFLRNNFSSIIIFAAFTSFGTITILLSSILISIRESKYVLVKDSLFGVSKTLVLFFLVKFGALGIFIAWGIGSLMASLLGIFFISRTITTYKPAFLVKRDSMMNMFHFSLWNYIANFFSNAPALLLPILITNLISPNAAAYFYISWMIANLLFAVPSQFSQSLFAEGSNTKKEIETDLIKSIKFIMFLLVPPIIFILFFGDKLLLLFGKEYSTEGFRLMQILSASSIPFAINTVYVSVKRIKKETRAVVINYGIVAIITLLGSYLLLKQYGVIGAGAAWILGNSIASTGIGLIIIKNKFKNTYKLDRSNKKWIEH